MARSGDTLRQREGWTEKALSDSGFKYYDRQKMVEFARLLPPEEAPLTIKTDWDTLIAEEGFFICFRAGDEVNDSLYDYEHWPLHPDHFKDLYEPWEEDKKWEPKDGEKHLLLLGCKPYFRNTGVWAKKLDKEFKLQSPESKGSIYAPVGAWLLIAAKGSAWGAPYSTTDENFRSRYVVK